jgi:hypothetical protein
MIRAAILFTLASASFAQITAPQLGLVPDGISLRPVAGIPAAAAIGAPVSFSRNLRQVTGSAQGFALAVDADSGQVLVVRTDGSAPSPASVPASPDFLQLGPSGTTAVLYYSANHHAQILSGLPNNLAYRDLDLTFISSSPSILVVTDDSLTVAGSWPGIVYEFTAAGMAGLPVNSPSVALAFAPGTSDLAIVSTANITLWNSTGTSILASFQNMLNPIAAAFDPHTLVVADAGGAIVTMDRASGSLSSLNCQCTPAGLFPLTQSAYRLTSLNQGSFKLLDTGQNAIWFAPLALSTPAGVQQ